MMQQCLFQFSQRQAIVDRSGQGRDPLGLVLSAFDARFRLWSFCFVVYLLGNASDRYDSPFMCNITHRRFDSDQLKKQMVVKSVIR